MVHIFERLVLRNGGSIFLDDSQNNLQTFFGSNLKL
jgi:hypothetical protein